MIAGRQLWLWRAVDDEGEVLDLLVQPRRDRAAAVKLMRKLLKKQGFGPDILVTDKLRSYGAAKSAMGLSDQPNDSCLFTPPSKTRSTSSAISRPATRSAPSEMKRSGRGEPPPRPEPELRLPILTRPNSVRVTTPTSRLPFWRQKTYPMRTSVTAGQITRRIRPAPKPPELRACQTRRRTNELRQAPSTRQRVARQWLPAQRPRGRYRDSQRVPTARVRTVRGSPTLK